MYCFVTVVSYLSYVRPSYSLHDVEKISTKGEEIT